MTEVACSVDGDGRFVDADSVIDAADRVWDDLGPCLDEITDVSARDGG